VPLLTLFAGPNGSGKSTLIARSTFEGKERILDADAIARRMNASNPAAKYYVRKRSGSPTRPRYMTTAGTDTGSCW